MEKTVRVWSPDERSGLEALNSWSSALDDNRSHWYELRERGEYEENQIEARTGQNTTT